MRRFDAIWEFSSGAYTDQTQLLSEGTSSITLSAGESLYFGLNDDWFAGVLAFLSTVPSPSPSYIIEQFDGDTWRSLPLEESLVNLNTGVELHRGSLFWGLSPFTWERLVFSTTVPENGTPVDSQARYWVRLRVVSGEIIIDRCLPQLYNTYASLEDLEGYIGFQFDDVRAPTRTTVRKMLRASEDWLDQYCRRSWRPRIAYNETYNFNPYGNKLRKYPPWFLISAQLWDGSNYQSLIEGKAKDVFLDLPSGQIKFTTPQQRLWNYTWLLSRHYKQTGSLLVTYAYGDDFDTCEYAELIREIVMMRTGARLINQSDTTGIFTSGMDTVSKTDKMRTWAEDAEEKAAELRMPLIS